jgi:hypothetical protein
MLDRASHVAWQALPGEGVLVDLRAGCALGLNPVGSFVWAHLPSTAEELAGAVSQEFAVDAEVARRDLDVFLADLQGRGLLVIG